MISFSRRKRSRRFWTSRDSGLSLRI